jgi:hypothetical protein
MPDFEKLLQFSEVRVDVESLVRIGGGFSSDVYATDDHVVKLLGHTHGTALGAHDHADILYGEQSRICDYLGPNNMALAHFVVGATAKGDYKVLLVQPRIEGVTLAESIRLEVETDPLCNYLASALFMYMRIREIPDLACMERRFFNPLIDPNTQVVTFGKEARPVLVDTTFGRTQRKNYVGWMIHAGIAHGVKQALIQLS